MKRLKGKVTVISGEERLAEIPLIDTSGTPQRIMCAVCSTEIHEKRDESQLAALAQLARQR